MFYKAIVENNLDEKKLKRVQVRIIGIHNMDKNEVPVESLPWANVIGSLDFPLNDGVGLSSTIEVGTWVWVYLQNNDIQFPLIIGTVIGLNNGVSDLNENTINNYLNNTCIKTKSGHIVEFNEVEGKEYIEIKHKTGTVINLDHEGNINVNVINDGKYNFGNNLNYNIKNRFDVLLKSFSVDNGSDELITVLSDLIQAIIDEQHIGNLGAPTALHPTSISKFTELKGKIDGFK